MAILLVVAVAVPTGVLLARDREPSQPRAILVDQLADTDPNPAFVQKATDMLHQAGYQVEYVPAEEVTVARYASIVEDRYEMIIIRSHSAPLRTVSGFSERAGTVQRDYVYGDVSIFTTEPFDPYRHPNALTANLLSRTTYDDQPDRDAFFGLTSRFFEQVGRGFPKSTIVLMGCGGLSSLGLAQALIDKGAESFVSWDGLVTAKHTDRATEEFLRLLLIEEQSVADSTAMTMDKVGPDPSFPGTKLRYYPAED